MPVMQVVEVVVFVLWLGCEHSLVCGRQAVNPNDENIEVIIDNIFDDDQMPMSCCCSIDINKDLAEPQPHFLQPNTSNYWLPASNGKIQVPHGGVIELYCSNSFSNTSCPAFHGAKSIFAVCLGGDTFLVDGKKFRLKQLTCTTNNRYSVENTGERCRSENMNLYRVGFKVENDRFVQTMKICLDESRLATLYVYHKITPVNVHFQRNVKRLNFRKAGYFGRRNMDYLYSQRNQKKIAQMLLEGNQERFFNNRSLFLSRGHLSAKADYIFAPQQRSTFNFFNVAPQWQPFNAGTWNVVENSVRNLAARWNLTLDCYTGTLGVITLPLADGQRRDIYLTFDENNNGLIPVPKLFYRVIVDSDNPKRGLVLIGVNNPHATLDEILNEYVVCEDVSASVPWINWPRCNLTKGYFYACAVNEFARVVQHLPKNLSETDNILTTA